MNKKLSLLLLVLFAFSMTAFAADPKITEIVAKMRENQTKVKDMKANITTIVKSDMKGAKNIEQNGSIMVKGTDKSRMEMTQPVNQITITNKDKMMMVNQETGQKYTQDLAKLRKQMGRDDVGQSPMDQTKILDYFNLTMEQKGKDCIITGVPKEKNKVMGKIRFYVDSDRYVPTKMEIYSPQGKIISTTKLEYQKIKDIWVVSNNSSQITVPGGSMQVEMKFENVKVNEGIDEKNFEIK